MARIEGSSQSAVFIGISPYESRRIEFGLPRRRRNPDRHSKRYESIYTTARPFLRELTVRCIVAFRHRIGRAHIEHGMAAVPKLALKHEAFQFAQRRRHRF